MLHFEDFPVGEVATFGDKLVTEQEIVAFARDWDPQPFHLDAEAAENSQIGELIASGWHTGAMTMRMMCDAYLTDAASEGSPGIDEMRWTRPVRPGDRLRARRTTLSARVLGSRPHIGVIGLQVDVINQHDETVLTMKSAAFIRRRETAA